MATLTVYPSGYDEVNSVYDSIGSSNPISNGYADATSTTYAMIYDVLGDNAETFFYYTFDLSSLPDNAIIDSISCTAKCHSSATSGLPTRQICMATGTTAKSDVQTLSTTAGTTYTFTPGTWTVVELKQAAIKLYVKRNTTSSSTARSIRFYGATLTVEYSIPVPDLTIYPSGCDICSSNYDKLYSNYPISNGYASADDTNLVRIDIAEGSGVESFFYYTFDLSDLSDDIIINSISCDVKASISVGSADISEASIYMTAGNTLKGSKTELPTSSTKFTLSPGTWTAAELKNAKICLYCKRSTTNVSETAYFRFYGATLDIYYTKASVLWKKQHGRWYKVGTGYSKASSTWTAASTPASLIDANEDYAQIYLLPSGYTLLSYVQSTGAQYVDTGIVPDANTKVEAEFALTQVDTTNRVMFGVLGQFTFRKYTTPAFRTNGNNYVNFTEIPADTAWHYVSKIPTSCTLVSEDGTTETKTNTVGTCTLTMSIFGYHTADSTYEQYSFMKLYYLKVYSSSTLVRYFIPCKNASNIVGLYDIVNNVFYSSGTSTALVEGDTLIKVP